VRALKFATIRELSNVFVDFIILLALGMDARRNQDQYVHRSDRTIDEFLGDGEWRDEWGREQAQNIPFSRFLATTFAKQMESLGYLAKGRETMREFRSDDNRSLYHIAFFSKSARGYDFWEKALQTASDQRKLSFDP
jgi:hypothetical protein